MRILVTGGAGFIGSHIADALIREGHEVHVMDNLSGGFRHNVPDDAHFHEVDIRSDEAAELIRSHRPDVLVHHAAQMDVRRSVADPRFDASVNVDGFLNLMEAGRDSGLEEGDLRVDRRCHLRRAGVRAPGRIAPAPTALALWHH